MYGGLAIPIFHETAEIEFMSSSKITSELTAYNKIEDTLKKLKTEIKKSIEENTKTSSKYYNRKKNALWICQL